MDDLSFISKSDCIIALKIELYLGRKFQVTCEKDEMHERLQGFLYPT